MVSDMDRCWVFIVNVVSDTDRCWVFIVNVVSDTDSCGVFIVNGLSDTDSCGVLIVNGLSDKAGCGVFIVNVISGCGVFIVNMVSDKHVELSYLIWSPVLSGYPATFLPDLHTYPPLCLFVNQHGSVPPPEGKDRTGIVTDSIKVPDRFDHIGVPDLRQLLPPDSSIRWKRRRWCTRYRRQVNDVFIY